MRFTLSPTVRAFHESRAFVKIICGPVGGGKSSGALMALWRMALDQNVHNGVRRSKFIILRNTMAQLKSTVKPLVDQWLVEMPAHPLGSWRLSENTFEIRMNLPDGTHVWTEFVMLAADTPDDVRRLLSMECTAAWIEEAREVVQTVAEGLQGRVGRFPNRAQGGVKYKCVICSTNPPPIGTYWHDLMSNPPSNVEVFMQPPALNDDDSLNMEADNIENLPPGYYADLMNGKSTDWIDVYLKNRYGAGGFGMPIFKGTFKADFHVATGSLSPVVAVNHPIIVGTDNGLTAGAVIGQQDAMGRINILADPHVPEGESMGYNRFLDSYIVPALTARNIPRQHVLFVADPACFSRSEATEETIAMVIQKAGFTVVPAPTNDVERRITAVETLLSQQVDGKGRVRIDPGCTHLINALDWGYRYKKLTSGQGTLTPEKNHHSHIADGLQCLCLHYTGAGTAVGASKAREVQRVSYVY